jgi:hypothetical protein
MNINDFTFKADQVILSELNNLGDFSIDIKIIKYTHEGE